MDIKRIKSAHSFSFGHKKELLSDDICGCFYCLEIFNPSEITEWVDDKGNTAICPYCNIDSIIGRNSGYSVTN